MIKAQIGVPPLIRGALKLKACGRDLTPTLKRARARLLSALCERAEVDHLNVVLQRCLGIHQLKARLSALYISARVLKLSRGEADPRHH